MPIPAGYSQGSGGFFFKDDGSGPYAIGSDGSIHLVKSTREFFMDVGFGLIPGYTRVTALGNKPDLSSTTPADVWTGGGDYPWMTGATSLEVVSTSAQDGPAGTGVATVAFNFLDTNYAVLAPTTVALNGLTPVPLVVTPFRCNGGLVMTKGSGAPAFRASNVGDIILRNAGGGTVRAIIPAGKGITAQSIYTVPLGFTLQIISSFFCVNRVTASNQFFTFSSSVQTSLGLIRYPLDISIGDEPPYRHDGVPGITLPQRTDFCWRNSFSSASRDVTAAFLGILRDNTLS